LAPGGLQCPLGGLDGVSPSSYGVAPGDNAEVELVACL